MEAQRIKNYLKTHKNIWISRETLEGIGNIPNSQLRAIISNLRKSGLTIVSQRGLGYKYSTNPFEISEYAKNEYDKHKWLLEMYEKWIGGGFDNE